MPKWWSVSDRESPALNRNVIIQVSGTSGGAKESRAGQWWREKRQVSRQLVYWWVAISSSQLSWTDICRFLSASILVVRLASKTTQLLLLREYDVQTTLFFPAGDSFLKSTWWLWMSCCLHIWGENDKRIDTCSSYKCVCSWSHGGPCINSSANLSLWLQKSLEARIRNKFSRQRAHMQWKKTLMSPPALR